MRSGGDLHDWLHRRLELDEHAALLVDTLSADEAATLGTAIDDADRSAVEMLDSAVEKALAAVPAVIRPPMRRVLRGRR